MSNTSKHATPIAFSWRDITCSITGGTALTGERFEGIRRASGWATAVIKPLPNATRGRKRQIGVAAAALGIVAGSFVGLSSASAADPCAAAANPVACENQKTGDSIDSWDISGVGNTSIQGYPTDMSVNLGG